LVAKAISGCILNALTVVEYRVDRFAARGVKVKNLQMEAQTVGKERRKSDYPDSPY
jgi:DNA-binding protein